MKYFEFFLYVYYFYRPQTNPSCKNVNSKMALEYLIFFPKIITLSTKKRNFKS